MNASLIATTIGVVCALISLPLIGLIAISISKLRKRLKKNKLENSNRHDNQSVPENK